MRIVNKTYRLLMVGAGLGVGLVLALIASEQSGVTETRTTPERAEAGIARVTALVLESSHYQGGRFNDDVSDRFFERYLKALDPGRVYFLQTDVDEFAPYRTTLDDLTLQVGDTSPAHRIYARYLERLEQRATFVTNLVATEKFEFTGSEVYNPDRDKALRPRDLDEAKQLWRQHARYEYLQEKLNNQKPEEIVKTLTRRYTRSLGTMKKFDRDQVFEIYLTALAHVFDPHSDYMGRRQMQDFAIHMKLSLSGIGATLRYEDGYCKVWDLIPRGPAARSGQIKVGDRITAVAQEGKEPVDIIDNPLTQSVELIRGPKGTQVTLTIIPVDAVDTSVRKTVVLIRDEIALEDQEAKALITDLPFDGRTVRMAIIDLPSFYSDMEHRKDGQGKSATVDVAKLLQRLKGEQVAGIILDLRRNGGGSLEEAVSLTGLFIEQGPVVQTKTSGPGGQRRLENDTDPSVAYEGPLVVLTSRLSASASEIVAGALQDYGRALVVGDSSTFGKGTVQTVLSLAPMMAQANLPVREDPGALKLTIRKFYLPGGASTQRRGVVPDIILPSANNLAKIGEAELENPLPWDEIAPANYTNLNLVKPFLPVLQEQSAKRVAADKEFAWLREDLDDLKKKMDNPVISLNEEQRRKEMAEAEARTEARKKERAQRPPWVQTNYEFTVTSASQPGFPEPSTGPKKNRRDLDLPENPNEPNAADKDPAVDMTLEEAKRILADYALVMARREESILPAANPRTSDPETNVVRKSSLEDLIHKLRAY
jgi:carboxyl-terminal processing protease